MLLRLIADDLCVASANAFDRLVVVNFAVVAMPSSCNRNGRTARKHA